MRDGDAFSKKFAEGDWFLLTVEGFDSLNQSQGTVNFYLADFRSADPGAHYILSDWSWVDLSGLGDQVSRVNFSLSSSDNNEFGMRTPGYFVMDQFSQIPEPGTIGLLFIGLTGMGLCARRHKS